MSADQIIVKFNENYQKVVKNLSPETIKQIFYNDTGCLRQFGKGIQDSSYACKYCELFGFLADLNPKTNKIKLHSGELKEETILIEKTDHPTLTAEWDNKIKNRHLSYENKFGYCNDKNETVVPSKYLILDSWTNDMVIEWILSDIYSDAGIMNVMPSVGSFVCRSVGYKLKIDSGSPLLNINLDEVSVLSIFKQLGCALRIIRHHNVVNPQATINNLIFNEESVNYIYRDIEIKSPFTLFLTGFNWASVEWNNIRVLPDIKGKHRDVDVAIRQNDFIVNQRMCPKITDMNEDEDENEDVSYERLFKINPEMVGLFIALRYSGFSIYAGVYDFYSYIISLLSWKKLRDIVESSERLTKWVNHIFPKKNFLIYWHKTEDTGLLTCPTKIATLLSEQYLYCDVFDRFLNA